MDIPSTDITDVWVKDTYSFVELKNHLAQRFQTIKDINGINVRIQIANPRKKENKRFSRDGDNRSRFHNKSFHHHDRNKNFKSHYKHK
jgi:hypothetical protein